jgi:MFS family permease
LQTHDHFITFVVASGFYLASTLPLARLKKMDDSNPEEKKLSIWRYIKNSPKIMFASFTVSYAISSATTFSIIYGIKIGMPQNEASLLISVLFFGTIFSIPIGYLADILNRRLMMLACAGLALICAVLLFFNHDQEKIYALLFLMFGCLAGVKLPAMVLINEKYKPTQRLAVNSAFSRFGLLGNICGLFCTGGVMKQFGPSGLWLSISSILFLFLLFCFVYYCRKILRKEFNPRKFSFRHNPNRNELLPDL